MEEQVTTWIVEQINETTGRITKTEFKTYTEAQSVYCDLTESKTPNVHVNLFKEEKQLLKG
jgi:hypothetical protein